VKTDLRDAERLVRLLAAGELWFAFVPSATDEQFRDVIRAIEDCRTDLMRARHRLSKMLLRRDIRWAGPGHPWTQKHMVWLRGLRFDDLCSQATFIDYLSGVEMLLARRAALIAAFDQVIPDSRHATTIASLRCFRRGRHPLRRGVVRRGGVTGSDFAPSSSPGFSGSFPPNTPPTRNADSDRSPRPGPRTPVDAAHHYRHQPAIGEKLARRQAGQDPRVIEISWRA
jgi:transposase